MGPNLAQFHVRDLIKQGALEESHEPTPGLAPRRVVYQITQAAADHIRQALTPRSRHPRIENFLQNHSAALGSFCALLRTRDGALVFVLAGALFCAGKRLTVAQLAETARLKHRQRLHAARALARLASQPGFLSNGARWRLDPYLEMLYPVAWHLAPERARVLARAHLPEIEQKVHAVVPEETAKGLNLKEK
jgi:hypothetical protein